ncbi:MAG: inorganic pyrophosphatase [Candidatus Bathyarchaeia archaeon]
MSTDSASRFIGAKVSVRIDRPLGSKHPRWRFKYPVNYGFVSEVVGKDGEPIDAYVLGIDKPLKEFNGICIAVIHRFGDEDKLVVAAEGCNYTNEQILKMTHFQEKYFKSIIIR